MAQNNARTLGRAFEGEAKKYLEHKGYRCVDRNYTCRGGELDLVLKDGDVWVFAEVKARRSARYGTPAEAVGYTKRRRLICAAQKYMQENCIEADCRFDVVEILYTADQSGAVCDMQVTHIINAFEEELF